MDIRPGCLLFEGMALSIDELEAEILKLPEEQQRELLDRMNRSIDAFDPGVREAWNGEIARRVQEIREGRAILFDEDDVMAEAEAMLNEKSKVS